MSTIDRSAARRGFGSLGSGTVFFAVALAACLVAWTADGRVIEGRPVWEKPAKFALSFAVHLGTLWLIEGWTARRSALFRWAAVATVAVAVLEFMLIALQAARGERSHFNVGTPFDAAVFTAMGIGIAIQTLAGFVMAFDLIVRPGTRHFPAQIAAAALIVGSLGAMTGLLMVRPSADQIAQAQTGERVKTSGQRFMGGTGQGQRLPGFGWSLEHGDLRVPHFVGIHGLQAVLLLGALLQAVPWPRRPAQVRAQGLVLGAIAYLGLTALLSYQALRGEAFVSISHPVALALGLLAAASAAGFAAILFNAYWRGSSGAAGRSA